MPKKNRNESIFIKPNSIKLKSFKKKNKKNFFKKDYKSLSKFSLASVIVILIFFGLPVMTNFMDENFRANIEVSNISKKNFEFFVVSVMPGTLPASQLQRLSSA